MRAWLLALPLLVLAGSAAIAQPAPAAIDCAVARSPVEKEICKEPWLLELDAKMAQSYRSLLASLAPDAAGRLRAEQRAWLRERERTCVAAAAEGKVRNLSQCLAENYDARTADLSPAGRENLLSDIGISRLPALPYLDSDADPALCGLLLRVVQTEYRRTGTMWIGGAPARYGVPVQWLPLVHVEPGNFALAAASANFADKPHRVVRQERYFWSSRSGDWTNQHLYLLAEADLAEQWQYLPEQQNSRHVPIIEKSYSSGGRAPLALFRWRQRIFALHQKVEREKLNGQIQATEITPSAAPSPICKIAPPRHEMLRAVVALDHALSSLGSGGADLCGICADERWRSVAPLVTWPWLYRESPFPIQVSTEAMIRAWGSSHLWNYREAQRMLAARQPAHDEIFAFYRDAFGTEESVAQRLAAQAVLRLMDRYNSAPAQYGAFRMVHPLLANIAHQPAGAASEPVPSVARVIEEAGQAMEAVPSSAATESRFRTAASGLILRDVVRDGENVLFRALEYPALVAALLDLGMDVDPQNRFGKTPLMYAAQFDLPETVRLLLARGANPAIRIRDLDINPRRDFSDDESEIHYRVSGGRTALDYAAQHAGETVLVFLLRAVAPVAAEVRASALNYLRFNWRQDDAARARMRAAIQAAP